MSFKVLKFGGSCLASFDKLQEVKTEVLKRHALGEALVVVVSAMGSTTDSLLHLASAFCENPERREVDLLISVGERVSMTLLSIALRGVGVEAKSFTGSQSGILTTEEHGDAKIVEVRPHRIQTALNEGCIAIVAGFQGMSRGGEVTTLGRGGSDISAVALGAALRAEEVIFYKDVDGVYLKDPKEEQLDKPFERLNYKDSVRIVSSAKRAVLHPRSIRLAERYKIPLRVRSLTSYGTEIVEDISMAPPSRDCVFEE